MSIDGIGKKGGAAGGGAAPSDKVLGTSRTGGAEKTFEVGSTDTASRVDASRVGEAGEVQGSSHLEALRAGTIDLDRYLDIKVDEATAHLEGLGSDDLEAIRSALRDKLTTDPDLIDLVSRATGSVPSPRAD